MKNKFLYSLILLILFILITVIAFIIPINKTISFWINFGFLFLSFIMQFVILFNSFSKNKVFLEIPVYYIGIVYLIIEILCFCILLIFVNFSYKIHLIVNLVVFVIFMILILLSLIGNNIISDLD